MMDVVSSHLGRPDKGLSAGGESSPFAAAGNHLTNRSKTMIITMYRKSRREKMIDKIETCAVWFLAGMAFMFCVMAWIMRG